jgi:glycosyltransferase involved in cell wall biosynthesis
MLEFLLVIPTINEDKYLSEILGPLRRVLKNRFKNYRMVIIDGSTDERIKTFLRGIAASSNDTDVILGREPHNKGADIMYAFSRYEAKRYCFVDADLAPSIKFIAHMLSGAFDSCDLVMGSRYAETSLVHRPKLRLFVSLAYNRMVNLIFSDGIKDHQCGLKMFDRKALEAVRAYSIERHFAWDTEAILACMYKNLKICEMPMEWTERRSRKTNMKRLVGDTLIFTPALLRMFYRFRVKRVVR